MPVRRRVAAIQDQRIDAMMLFTWSSGNFTSNIFGEPSFPSRAAAARAWPAYRRRVWAQTHRFRLPAPAREFDGLTLDVLDDLLSRWGLLGPFDVEPSLRLLAADRQHLETFAATRGARPIEDYLQMLRTDIDVIETTVRSLAAVVGRREYPKHVTGSAEYYGDATDPRTPVKKAE